MTKNTAILLGILAAILIGLAIALGTQLAGEVQRAEILEAERDRIEAAYADVINAASIEIDKAQAELDAATEIAAADAEQRAEHLAATLAELADARTRGKALQRELTRLSASGPATIEPPGSGAVTIPADAAVRLVEHCAQCDTRLADCRQNLILSGDRLKLTLQEAAQAANMAARDKSIIETERDHYRANMAAMEAISRRDQIKTGLIVGSVAAVVFAVLGGVAGWELGHKF